MNPGRRRRDKAGVDFFKVFATRRTSPGSTWLLIATVIASALTLYALTPPAGFVAPYFWVLFYLWAAIGLGWSIMLFTSQRSRLLLLAPVLVLGTLVTLWTDLPTELGFKLSMGELFQHSYTLESGRAGIFTLDKPTADGNLVVLPLRDTGFLFTDSGFLFAPSGIPDGYGEDEYESFESGHLEGSWHWYIGQN